MFALSLLCGAHLGEIVRGEVPSTQIDAGRSVGRTFLMLVFYVFAGVFFLIDFAIQRRGKAAQRPSRGGETRGRRSGKFCFGHLGRRK
jgi:hypothetical protein